MKHFAKICALCLIFMAAATSVSCAAATEDDYSTIITSLPALGAHSTEFPSFISFSGDPNYAGSFTGKRGDIQIDGYVQNGLIYSFTIQPQGKIGSNTFAAIAGILEEKYGTPVTSIPGTVYEWKYTRNGLRWYIQFACEAGIIMGQQSY